MLKISPRLLAIVIGAVLCLSACAAPPAAPRVFWPPPPGEPRLEFLGVYYSQDNFPKTASERLAENVVGKPPMSLFQRPFGIAADGKGVVYVSDADERQVKVFDFNARTVSYLVKGKVFTLPFGLAVDRAGNLYVADAGPPAILVFGPDHQPKFSFGSREQFDKPVYLAINEDLGRIYVSDGLGHKIAAFDMAGNPLFTFGKPGAGPGELHSPQGLAIAPDGRVFVADMFNARIQTFDADGNYLSEFGERGDRQWQFEAPKDLVFDSEGNLHVIDARKSALLTYRPDGTLLLYTSSGKTASPLALALPAAISIDQNDTMYVTDQINRRFARWQYLNAPYLQEHPISEEEMEAVRRRAEEIEKK
jgi:DNA-binding beta-propeller fold protein YncE